MYFYLVDCGAPAFFVGLVFFLSLVFFVDLRLLVALPPHLELAVLIITLASKKFCQFKVGQPLCLGVHRDPQRPTKICLEVLVLDRWRSMLRDLRCRFGVGKESFHVAPKPQCWTGIHNNKTNPVIYRPPITSLPEARTRLARRPVALSWIVDEAHPAEPPSTHATIDLVAAVVEEEPSLACLVGTALEARYPLDGVYIRIGVVVIAVSRIMSWIAAPAAYYR